MGIYLYEQATLDTPTSSESKNLRLLAGYENGGVVLRQFNRSQREISVEGHGWDIIWKAKIHAETSTSSCYFEPIFSNSNLCVVMAMRVSRGNSFVLSVSADHIVGRYDLTVWNILLQNRLP
jgi:hypothetical protein